jgi:hypothetical protein
MKIRNNKPIKTMYLEACKGKNLDEINLILFN